MRLRDQNIAFKKEKMNVWEAQSVLGMPWLKSMDEGPPPNIHQVELAPIIFQIYLIKNNLNKPYSNNYIT